MIEARQIACVGFLIAAVTAAVFLPSLGGEFLNWDDGRLIEFAGWRGGRPENVRWWFSSLAGGDFKPLVWASYAADHALWGMNTFGYHLGNIVLHSLNAALLFYLLILFLALSGARTSKVRAYESVSPGARTGPDVPETGRRDDCCRNLKGESKVRAGDGIKTRSSSSIPRAFVSGWPNYSAAAVAALFFSLHPLRVETVAWITERKGCLSGFFFLLSLLLYAAYASRRRGRSRAGGLYLVSFLSGLGACLAKPSAVSLPLALLVLDLYPLERAKEGWRRLIAEKIPYLLLSLGTGLMAVAGQRASSALAPLKDVGLAGRFLLAARAVFFYLGKTAWPFQLAPVYSPDGLPAGWRAGAALVALGAVLFLCLRLWRRQRKYALAAFLFYLVLLFPVSGFFRTGAVALADRFSYLPALAFSLALAFLLSTVPRAVARPVRALSAGALAGLAFLTLGRQAAWSNSISLWLEASARAPSSALVFNNLGRAFADAGRGAEAGEAYRRALEIEPRSAEALTNLGTLKAYAGDLAGAADLFRAALEQPSRFSPEAHNNLGNVLAGTARTEEAVRHFEAAIRLRPEYPEALNNLANALALKGDLAGAEARYREAIRLRPDYPAPWLGLGGVLQETGRIEEAVGAFRRCVALDPSRASANYYLGQALAAAGREDEAAAYLRKAAELGAKKLSVISDQ